MKWRNWRTWSSTRIWSFWGDNCMIGFGCLCGVFQWNFAPGNKICIQIGQVMFQKKNAAHLYKKRCIKYILGGFSTYSPPASLLLKWTPFKHVVYIHNIYWYTVYPPHYTRKTWGLELQSIATQQMQTKSDTFSLFLGVAIWTKLLALPLR